MGETSGPLAGIRVLDLSQWQQGPYATVLLSDLGAEVIKVEKPLYGDAGRHGMGGWNPETVAPDFFAHNRGKRGITIELSHPKGRDLVLQLAGRSDVLVNNFRPGQMEKWGLGYEALRERNPALVYAHASGWGKAGPDAGKPMFDIVAQAAGGIMSVTGEAGRVPHPVGTFMGDQYGATMLAVGILGALVARERTGEGQTVDVSLLGSQIALQSFEITHHLFTGEVPRKAGRGHPHAGVLWNTFPASDGHFTMAGVREDIWPEFCNLVGEPGLATDSRFDTYAGREENQAALLERLDAVFSRERTAHWMALLAELDIACGAVQNYADVARDPQVLANGYIGEMDYPGEGTVRIVNTPIAYGATPVQAQGPAPELGQHTEEILLELGYDWPDILALREEGAI